MCTKAYFDKLARTAPTNNWIEHIFYEEALFSKPSTIFVHLRDCVSSLRDLNKGVPYVRCLKAAGSLREYWVFEAYVLISLEIEIVYVCLLGLPLNTEIQSWSV